MSNRGTTSTGLWVEFQAAVLRQLPRPEDAESTVFEGWTKNQDALKSALAMALLPSVSNLSDDIDWQKAYKVLGLEVEYAEFTKAGGVKEDPNLWVVPVVKGVTCNKVVATLRNLKVNVYTYVDDLDNGVPTNDRDLSNSSYAISFARAVEADEANKNLSANMLKKRDHKGITLLERLLLELGYFMATGKHLDERNATLCTGSRNSDGYIPYVYWSSVYRLVSVGCCSPGGRGGGLRSRSAVS